MRFLSVFLSLTTCGLGVAQEAIIKAPNQVVPGDLVMVDGTASTGSGHLWVIDERIKERCKIRGKEIFFSIGTPGQYIFQLIIAECNDKKTTIDQATHVVTVSPPVKEEPGSPASDWEPTSPLFELSQKHRPEPFPELAEKLWQGVQEAPSDLQEQKAFFQDIVSEVLLKKEDQTWNKWRAEVFSALEKLSSSINYLNLIEDIATSLTVPGT